MIEIFLYISQDNKEIAAKFVADINKKINWIAQVDFTGAARDHVSNGLRALPYRNRCIYYRSYPDKIVVVRILHGAQDVTQQEFKEQ